MRKTKNQKRIQILMWSNNLLTLGEGMLGPFFAVFAEKIGGNILDITWAYTIYLLASGILTILIGKISDTKVRKEYLLAGGYLLNTIVTLGYLFVNTPVKLFIAEAGFGLAAAMIDPTWNALYSKYMNKERTGETWGKSSGFSEIMAALSLLLGGLIITYTNFTLLFLIMASIQFMGFIYQASILKEVLSEDSEKEMTLLTQNLDEPSVRPQVM